jgi:hypothetical protein
MTYKGITFNIEVLTQNENLYLISKKFREMSTNQVCTFTCIITYTNNYRASLQLKPVMPQYNS